MTPAHSTQSYSEQKRVLFLDKVLVRGKKGVAVNGAERFNLHLIGSLQDHGVACSVYAASSWNEDVARICDHGALEHSQLPSLFRVAWPNSLLTNLLLRFRKSHYDAVIVGNVGRNVMPLVQMSMRRGCFKKIILLAHREPTKLFLRLLRGLDVTIMAVNDKIAQDFINAGYPDTSVYFGEIRRDFFTPSETAKKDGTINFCVFGNLDPAWKGSDVAVEAFRALPPEISQRAHLHLAGFAHQTPQFEEANITAYSWIPEDDIPAFLNTIDVAIVPSRDTTIMKETFSQASVQAMLMGIPLIVSSLPILQEKVANGGGLVFHTPDELTQHIATLCEDKELRKQLGEQSHKIAKQQFLWDTKHFISNFLFPEQAQEPKRAVG